VKSPIETGSVARGLLAAGALAVILGGCQQSRSGTDVRVVGDRSCAGAQAMTATNLYGTSLGPKTISLTFDDGPGERTAELSAYLAAQGIKASFFVNGKMLTGGTAILGQLVADGHVVANHTQTHTSLTGRATGGQPLTAPQIVAEVTQTDTLIAPFVPGDRFMFRAPYGDFDAQSAAALDASPMKKYVGPINWDIGDHMGPGQAADWDCWIPGADNAVLTPQQCGDRYVAEIDAVGRGVVLMHDPYFVVDDPAHPGTVDMVKYVVPILKAKGYTFVRIDEVPEIAALLPALAPDAGSDASPPTDAGAPPPASTTPPLTAADAGTPPSDPCAH
jgi:peptidoglycan/xylan/chitin deacetylase (PgdA/CDA1 family)